MVSEQKKADIKVMVADTEKQAASKFIWASRLHESFDSGCLIGKSFEIVSSEMCKNKLLWTTWDRDSPILKQGARVHSFIRFRNLLLYFKTISVSKKVTIQNV